MFLNSKHSLCSFKMFPNLRRIMKTKSVCSFRNVVACKLKRVGRTRGPNLSAHFQRYHRPEWWGSPALKGCRRPLRLHRDEADIPAGPPLSPWDKWTSVGETVNQITTTDSCMHLVPFYVAEQTWCCRCTTNPMDQGKEKCIRRMARVVVVEIHCASVHHLYKTNSMKYWFSSDAASNLIF